MLDITPTRFKCLRIWVEDEFDDGWDVAELIVENPNGVKRSYKTECDSVNPLVHRYCPVFNDEASSKGIHKLYVADGKEAKFNWEIIWRVYDEATAKWYLGDVNTQMDFEWQYRDNEFLPTRTHDLRQNLTCTVCPRDASEWEEYQKSLQPAKPKAKSLHNLRALYSRAKTVSPTISPAPTIAVDYSQDWNMVEIVNDAGGGVTEPWFNGEGRGTSFYISDTDGKKLVYSGSGCTAGNVAIGCYIKLDDGEYVMRVTGANDVHTLQRRWKFCQSLNYHPSQTELYFSIVDGVCYPVMTRHQTLVCDNILKITNLNVEIVLSGDFSALVGTDGSGVVMSVSRSQLQPVALAASSAFQKVFGYDEYSSSVEHIKRSSSNSIVVSVNIGLKNFDENMLSTLEDMELGGGQKYRNLISDYILSSPTSLGYDSSVMDALTKVTLVTISIGSETVDYAAEDESNFNAVKNFIPVSSDIKSPSEVMIEGEHVLAIAGYVITIATIFVAIGFVYSTIKKRVYTDPSVDNSPIKPSVARTHLHLIESSSDEESEDEEGLSATKAKPVEVKSRDKTPRKVAKHSKRNSYEQKFKRLLENVSCRKV